MKLDKLPSLEASTWLNVKYELICQVSKSYYENVDVGKSRTL